MEVFALVCETGSVSAAAARLGVSQAAVSRQIIALERTVGEPLFQRSAGRPNVPSATGLAILDHARAAVAEGRRIAEVVRAKAETLRVGGDQIIIGVIFTPHRQALEQSLAPHRLELVVAEGEAEPGDLVERLNLDLLYVTLGDGERPPEGARCVAHLRNSMFASPALLQRCIQDTSLPVVIPAPSRRVRGGLGRIVATRLVGAHTVVECDAAAAMELVLTGAGAGLMSIARAAPYVAAGLLEPVPNFDGPFDVQRYEVRRAGLSDAGLALGQRLAALVEGWLR